MNRKKNEDKLNFGELENDIYIWFFNKDNFPKLITNKDRILS